MAKPRRITLNDLADSLGLSANTVSRAVTGKDGVSERTRNLVLDEARRVGYLAGPTLTSHAVQGDGVAARTIAVVAPSSTHVFAAELIGAIESGTRAAGYSLDLFLTEDSPDQESQIAAMLTETHLAGAIVIPVHGDHARWSPVRASGPLVLVSREIPGLDCDFVGVDSRRAEYAAVRHLLSQGARSVVFFEEDLQISTIALRRKGFDDALAEFDGAVGHVIRVPTRRFETGDTSWRADEAYRAARAFLETSTAFDAVTVGDDLFALGVIRALGERGLRVPDDVRVVGYGDHPYAAWTTPTLSSVRLPTRLIGELAVALLLQRIAGDTKPAVKRLIKAELVVRESTAPLP